MSIYSNFQRRYGRYWNFFKDAYFCDLEEHYSRKRITSISTYLVISEKKKRFGSYTTERKLYTGIACPYISQHFPNLFVTQNSKIILFFSFPWKEVCWNKSTIYLKTIFKLPIQSFPTLSNYFPYVHLIF